MSIIATMLSSSAVCSVRRRRVLRAISRLTASVEAFASGAWVEALIGQFLSTPRVTSGKRQSALLKSPWPPFSGMRQAF